MNKPPLLWNSSGDDDVFVNEPVLMFDKHDITEDQIIFRVRHYVQLAEKGLEFVDSNKKEAMNYLKKIRSSLEKEYNYYSRINVSSPVWDIHLYNTYRFFIDDAFVKQISPNKYDTLRSNLDNVRYQGRQYFRKHLDQIENRDG